MPRNWPEEWRLQFQAPWEVSSPRTDGHWRKLSTPQSRARVASPPPKDDREPRTGKGGRPLSRAQLIGHFAGLLAPANAGDAAQSRRGTPGCAGGSRAGGGAEGPGPRSLVCACWGRPNPQGVAAGDRSANAGGVRGGDTASASASPRCSRASRLGSQLPRPRRSKPRKCVSDAGPPTHKA